MTSPTSHRYYDQQRRNRPATIWRDVRILLFVAGLIAAITAGAGARSASADPATEPQPGTCASLGLSVVEPQSVGWESESEPVSNPRYSWAYGDVALLWDDAFDDYWYHWYDAVPGDDPYVVYRFAPGTTLAGVQFTNDWSNGDLELVGLDSTGQPVSGVSSFALGAPSISYAAALDPMTVQAVKMTTSTQQVKLLELDFCGEGGTLPPVAGCGAEHDPADRNCDSVNVIDSFGDAPLPAGVSSGPQWDTVRSYYDEYGSREGMCSMEVHNSYWTAVRDADGGLAYYPSWHPPVHDEGGLAECLMTHGHGANAQLSDLYDEDSPTNIGVPFGFVHPGTGGASGRIEDHVGHKVVVANNFQLTSNNPYTEGITLNLYEPNGVAVTCDWYSKLHQGTHSQDALGFNLHEYFLNYSCDDGTEVRLKEMTDFGFRTPDQADSPSFALNGGPGTANSDCGWFATNFPGPSSDPDPSEDSDFGDAGRGFTCLMSDAKIEELWKPSAYLSAPDHAGTIAYDPYYVVMNPNRFALYRWWDYLEQDGDHVGENALISMVDFCVEGSELRNELSRAGAPSNWVKSGYNFSGEFRVQTACNSIEPSVRDQWAQDIVNAGGDNATLMAERKHSVDNPFIGTRRGVHVKGPVVYGREANVGSSVLFCSNHLGNDSVWPTNPSTGASVTPDAPWSSGDPAPVCASGVAQMMSDFNNGHHGVEGSTAGATPVGGGLQGNGPGGEIIIDMDALYPNHGIRAPN